LKTGSSWYTTDASRNLFYIDILAHIGDFYLGYLKIPMLTDVSGFWK
jgi:hypothetical protein